MSSITTSQARQAAGTAQASRPGEDGRALNVMLGVTAALFSIWLVAGGVGMALTSWCAPDPDRAERARVAALGPGGNLDVEMVAHGKAVFRSTCAVCHGEDARGLPGRGKNLAVSEFVARQDDGGLVAFVVKGRPATDPLNTTKMEMPPKGGNATLTEGELGHVVSYLRSVQNPMRVSAAGLAAAEARLAAAEAKADEERAAAKAARLAQKAAEKPVVVVAAGTAAAGGGAAQAAGDEEEDDAETIAEGAKLFAAGCATCHGADAKGLPNNGKDLVHSTFVRGLKGEELAAFIKRGRDPGDPLNTTKIAMPPKGGNPALNDDKIDSIVAFVRSLNKAGK